MVPASVKAINPFSKILAFNIPSTVNLTNVTSNIWALS